jgi:hypothetical protein
MTLAVVREEQIETLSALADRLDARGLGEESQSLRRVLSEIEHLTSEVPAASAAEILGVTPQVIRNWVRAGILPGRRDRTGRFYVNAEALRPALDMRRARPDAPPRALTDDEIDAEIEAVRAERRSRATPR